MPRLLHSILLTLAATPAFARAAENSATRPIDYNRDVRPILSENCFLCHGFDEKTREADLRLDVAESALADRDGVPALVPGKPDESELWRRVSSTDEAEMMPPPDSHRVLKPEQKEVLKRWIEEGAAYAKHWSFIPPVKADLPEVSDANWPRNEIDHFVLARLDADSLKPSPAADRRTLARRVALDLTGLPPSADEVEAFVADQSPDAYERYVDRLLASPHFGERMALDWLDAARYADTNGYSIDGGRHMWLWRDWVINAFNTNMPYDEFLREQLAGDLIPNHTESQLIATGFQRNNMNTHEGGTIPEENLTNYNVDRVKTLGEAVLGLTLGCCQCHDHKFDPLTQRDFYQLYAYFNTLSDVGLDGDRGIDSRPSIDAKTVLQTGEEPELKKRIASLKQKLANPSDDEVERWVAAQRLRLSSRGRDFALHPVELLKVSTPNTGSGFDIEPPRFVHISTPAALVAYDVSMQLPKLDRPITGVRVVFHPDPNAPGGGRGYGAIAPNPLRKKPDPPSNRGTFIVTAFTASADPVAGDNVNLNRMLGIDQVTADSWLDDWRPEGVIDTRGDDGWSPAPGEPATGEPASAGGAIGPAHLTVTFDKPIDTTETPFMTIQLNFGHVDSTVAARFEFLAMTGTDDGSDLPQDIIEIINNSNTPTAPGSAGSPPSADGAVASATVSSSPGATAGSPSSAPSAQSQNITSQTSSNQLAPPSGATGSASAPSPRTPEQTAALRAYYAAHSDSTKRDRVALANLEERLAVITQKFPTMVMDVAPQPRDTFILNRGDYAQPTEKVTAATPAVLPKLPSGEPASAGGPPDGLVASATTKPTLPSPSTRLDLARWATMRENPLTARVFVNRVWQMLFGIGLVNTPADFGAQGEYPSHPELLDWLAVDFMDHNWDFKRLTKQIVTSASYQQSSNASDDLLARDPQNRLLARGPRFRLPAEFIRDSALQISGLLVDRLGGPSVNPYTPGNLWREISHYGSSPATAQTFEQDHGEKLYRRSLYTYWKRTVPPPNMVAFDAPNRETCTVHRAATTTPLQALVLLNDVQFVEASRAFAERIIARDANDDARLRWAFAECTSRTPTDTELAVLQKALARERARYTANEPEARAYLVNGESLRNESIPPAEHAAWSQIAALLLNLSETVTRN